MADLLSKVLSRLLLAMALRRMDRHEQRELREMKLNVKMKKKQKMKKKKKEKKRKRKKEKEKKKIHSLENAESLSSPSKP